MSKVVYGKTGVRKRDYRVWINFESQTGEGDEHPYITAIEAIESFNGIIGSSIEDMISKFEGLKAFMYHIGEMRADSIDLSIEDGNSIVGNELGKIVIDKNCKFSAELINSTPDILNWLADRDGQECVILLEEINEERTSCPATYLDDSRYEYTQLKTSELIIIADVPAIMTGATYGVGNVFSYSEKVVGKDTIRVTIGSEKAKQSASNFRKIYDVFTEDELIVTASMLAVNDPIINHEATIEIEINSGVPTPGLFGMLKVLVDDKINPLSVTHEVVFEVNPDNNIIKIDSSDWNLDYTRVARVFGLINGIPKTKYLEVNVTNP
jgi:hypothetical protein